jgi:Secretion system C-terminal sorting domain
MIRTMKTATKISLFVSLMMVQKQTKAQSVDTSRFVMQVVFVQYDASSSDDGITLKWTTILETNLGAYIIERSNGNDVFTEVGRINAKGSNYVSVPYTFTDKNPMKGINVYRLKMVDTRGGFKYSEYKQFIWTKVLSSEHGIKSYPNPAKPGNSIQIDVAFKGAISIQLLNIKGARLDINNQNIGAHGSLVYRLPSSLEKGMYIIVVTNNANESRQAKVMIM